MAVEFFHIRDNDYDLLDQIIDLEESVYAGRAEGLNIFEIYSFIRYGRVYVAVEYDEILGCCYFMRDFDNPGKVFLYGILTAPKEMGKNLGEALLKAAFADLRESGLRMVEVTAHPANRKALRIYQEELGFHVINVPDGASAEDEDFLILRKTL